MAGRENEEAKSGPLFPRVPFFLWPLPVCMVFLGFPSPGPKMHILGMPSWPPGHPGPKMAILGTGLGLQGTVFFCLTKEGFLF